MATDAHSLLVVAGTVIRTGSNFGPRVISNCFFGFTFQMRAAPKLSFDFCVSTARAEVDLVFTVLGVVRLDPEREIEKVWQDPAFA